MKQTDMFASARWVCHPDANARDGYILRSRFTLSEVTKATLRVLGLGFFHCYINGCRVGDDLFLPLNSDFEPRESYPVNECVQGHRIYVPEYDVTSYLHEGENVLTIHFGGGWYTYDWDCRFGDPKAIFRLFGDGKDGAFEVVSSLDDLVAPSFVTHYYFTFWETQDYTRASEGALVGDVSCADFRPVCEAPAPKTTYEFSDCPADGVAEVLPVRVSASDVPMTVFTTDEASGGQRDYTVTGTVFATNRVSHATVYDGGKNISGYPVLRVTGKRGEIVRVALAEECAPDGSLVDEFTHGQTFLVVCDGEPRTVRPALTWYGFRYVCVLGPAEVEAIEVVHTKAAVTGAFRSDNALLNWLHDTFVNTQLTNMHAGIPSDCPHLERRGYTGDGQLICHSAMTVLDAEAFYRKWIEDIRDCQDVESGHVQYTAPYTRSGGGPGGWGCAIVEVPYQFYRHYGDVSVLAEMYPSMLRYFTYMESHSARDLVLSDKEGEWCLGDWCPPTEVVLPAPFVNNYFYIRSLKRAVEIARLVGHEEDIPMLEERIATRSAAIMDAYYNVWDGNFLGGVQGANAFALDIGLGDERTYPNMVARYRALGEYDTGIFGTELVTRLLFERGDADVAMQLLLSERPHSFGEMRRLGATTLGEYWPQSLRDRSHNHPMFGAVTGLLYDHLLGIGQPEGGAGYTELVIAPTLVDAIDRLQGERMTPNGVVRVGYERGEGHVSFRLTVPHDTKTTFMYNGKSYELTEGEHRLQF